MMEAFHHLWIKTTLIEMADQVMTPVDREMAGFAHGEIRAKGIDLRLGAALKSVEYRPAATLPSTESGNPLSINTWKANWICCSAMVTR